MKEIDMQNWPRREIFEFFSQTRRPFYSLCLSVDVSKAYRFAKSRGLSFYYCMTWLVTQAVNRVEAFLYTIREGKVFMLPGRKPSFSPASTAGRLKMMRFISLFFNALTANAIAT